MGKLILFAQRILKPFHLLPSIYQLRAILLIRGQYHANTGGQPIAFRKSAIEKS